MCQGDSGVMESRAEPIVERRNEPAERRSEPRYAVKDVLVKLRFTSDAEPITCFVWDISRRGMRLKLPTRMSLPARVYVTEGHLIKPARVAWVKGDRVGLEFIQAIPDV